MKITTLFLIIFLSSFFTLIAQNNQEFDPNIILGKWTISATKSYNVNKDSKEETRFITSLCNSCPEITFSSDRIAKIKFPTGEVENYIWRIENNKLFFLLVGESKENQKLDSEYQLKLNDSKGFTELELIENKNSYSYILRK